jgi:formylglycine-generating enzyme required for sulfatase activity
VSVEQLDVRRQLREILALAPVERPGPLSRLCERLDGKIDGDFRTELTKALVDAASADGGTAAERVVLGERLGWLGDPRLRRPKDPDYWVHVPWDEGSFVIGRCPVTNDELRAFVDAGGYQDRKWWSDEGWAWLQSCPDPWPKRTEAEDARPFMVPNQPVVSVSWHEAQAYATWAGARLPRFDERTHAVRGDNKRPYPWGSPFGEGNANTREEVLGRPCAVGLYLRDRTPEGIVDLAGNVGEWAGDGTDDERWYAPGGWDQPSMAAWAKARELEQPNFRSTGLGFRLAATR